MLLTKHGRQIPACYQALRFKSPEAGIVHASDDNVMNQLLLLLPTCPPLPPHLMLCSPRTKASVSHLPHPGAHPGAHCQ